MGETNERIDRGTWWHDGGDAATSGMILSGLPMGDYRIYAERLVEEPLNERMAERFHELGLDTSWRMQTIIDELGLVERSKLPDPVAVPDDVKEAATFLFFNGWGVGSVENVDSLVRWVLGQAGETNG